MIRVTVDYDGEQAAPEPASAVIGRFLRGSFSIADTLKNALRGWLFGLIGMALGAVFVLKVSERRHPHPAMDAPVIEPAAR